ncbi:hypothetical protein RUM43_009796 [Polyplax serrata]|uniref:Uncharacterized protein n=1 Tax=Polyplax serrata TaxID=468196 RepID=A0AAN8S4H1_POLSC
MTSLKTSEKPFSESSKSCYESGRTDSGFLSGANLLSEENLSSEDLSGAIESSNEAGKNCPQLDSGVDIGLNVKFSGLAIDLKQGTKEQTGEAGGRESKAGVTNSATNEVKPGETGVTQPWELYFQQDEDGDTQLHIAIIQGFIEVVYSLIKMVPHPCFLDIPNDIVQSPLHLAVLTHQARIVRSLLVAGACVKARDRHGNTPLHLACQLGDLECVKALTEPISVSEMATANTFHSGHVNVPQDFEEGNYDGECYFKMFLHELPVISAMFPNLIYGSW